MTEQLHTSLTFVWDGDNGRVDRASLARLMTEHGIVILDFLTDIQAEAERLYTDAMRKDVLWKKVSTRSQS